MTVSRRALIGVAAALVPVHHSARREPSAREDMTEPGPTDQPQVSSGYGRPRVAGGTMYLGAYGDGLGIAKYDSQGKISTTGTIAGVPDPSFVIRDGTFLYAVNEQDAGAVTAIDISATPKVLNRQPTKGSGPCHLARIGDHLLSANYGSGDVAVHPINPDGSLGQPTDLVKHEGSEPHAHQVVQAGNYVLAVDLGTDSVYTYTLAAGKLTLKHQAKLKAGAGPRHLVLSGKFAYVADELDSTVTICGYDDGVLTPLSTRPTTPGNGPQNYPGEILTSADGRYVYVTNRGHNSIAIFRVAGADLELIGTPSCGGDWPRHAAFDPTGSLLFVANQKSNNVATFAVDRTTGVLTRTSDFSTPTPVCVNV
ncbi:6-phosphogluconolactonase [Kribbella aluminosa]|uniref:6-phosphogluconolactonase n=1 Tax=Kribbella aluminosa TaxID=416017 RepID=A0ABS4UYD9_9ACTN|nr:lactonase family protein [Kribbella aluminosa]MBP2356668.1 6-phosphogluconolactonase [Kribbella aluminosa]